MHHNILVRKQTLKFSLLYHKVGKNSELFTLCYSFVDLWHESVLIWLST